MTGHIEQQTTSGQIYLAEVFVSLKPVVNDPEGLEIRHGLHMLGFTDAAMVRSAKYIQVAVHAESEDQARQRVIEMCEQLLTNPVIEEYRVTVTAQAEAT